MSALQDTGTNKPANILVVDDDLIIRSLLKRVLSKAGFNVFLAENGKVAIDEHLSEEIGAVLLDLQMPVMGGMECLRYINKHYPDLAPIMLTANEEVTNAVEAMKYGAFDYVIKPFKSKQLVALAQRAFQTYTQTKRLRKVEAELIDARENEIFIASKIQRSLLLGRPPEDIKGLKINALTIPSQKVDGDFIDFFKLDDHTVDVVVADVMGKGLLSAFFGAAMKSHFLRALHELTIDAVECGMIDDQCMLQEDSFHLPQPQDIITRVQARMIRNLEELESFVTLCYARFDMVQQTICFVDCGHVRTIHYKAASGEVDLLQGINMPLGFPEIDPFIQFSVPFKEGDLFFFYSDGLTENRNPANEMYDEDRLVNFIKLHGYLEPEIIIESAYAEMVAFADSKTFDDDFTCVAVKIDQKQAYTQLNAQAILEIKSDLKELARVRFFIRKFCENVPDSLLEPKRIDMLEVAVTEVATNIIRHAYAGRTDEVIQIKAQMAEDKIILLFYDWGPQGFDPQSVPPLQNISKMAIKDLPEGGMGCYIIAQSVDEVEYSRNQKGKNCTSLKIILAPETND
ncbi:SpoIIE family protein phosphatase [Desulfococcaceae bacterium HSG9]|nr:SpoIIE family protein phosphatase [Desulfococcaceae bacterium HSG9]